MGQHVAIDTILTGRKLDPGDDITDLANHIRDSGLKVPILTTHNYELIDGLRRLEALRSLGYQTVEVAATSMYPQVCMWLKKARTHGVHAKTLTPRRIWEIYDISRPLMNITRSHLQRGRSRQPGVRIGGRAALAEALGLTSEAPLQAITQLYRAAREDSTERGTRAREAVERLEAGETTIYMAVESTRVPEVGDIVKIDDQRAALQVAVSTLNGLGHGLARIGPLNKRLNPEEVEGYLKELRRFRRDFYRFIHRLEEEIKSK